MFKSDQECSNIVINLDRYILNICECDFSKYTRSYNKAYT